jgi:hypothetical protein
MAALGWDRYFTAGSSQPTAGLSSHAGDATTFEQNLSQIPRFLPEISSSRTLFPP